MNDQRKNEVKVGLTVLIAVGILLFGFFTFKEWSVESGKTAVVMQFASSAGLQVGDEVSINGYKAGKVESIQFDGTNVTVHALLEPGIRVTKDAVPRIQMLELMGGKKIDIVQGQSAEALPPGGVLQGRVDPDIPAALGFLGEVKDDIGALGKNANQTLVGVNQVLADSQFIGDLKATVGNLRALSEDLRGITNENRSEVKELTATAVRLSRTLDTLLAEVKPRTIESLDNADALIQRTDSLVAEAKLFLTEVRESKGLLNTVLHDTSLVARTNQLIERLDSIMTIVAEGQLRIKIRL